MWRHAEPSVHVPPLSFFAEFDGLTIRCYPFNVGEVCTGFKPGIGDGGAGTLELVLQAGRTIARRHRVFVRQRHWCSSLRFFFTQPVFCLGFCHVITQIFKQIFSIRNVSSFGGAIHCPVNWRCLSFWFRGSRFLKAAPVVTELPNPYVF